MDRFVLSLPKGPQSRSSKASISMKRKREELDKENFLPSSRKTQLYLDFGQKSLMGTSQCENCGLLFRSNDQEDLKEHEQFCKSITVAPQFSPFLSSKFTLLHENDSKSQRVFYLKAKSFKAAILNSSSSLRKLKEMMNLEFDNAIDDLVWDNLDLYTFVSGKVMVAAVLIEHLTAESRVFKISCLEDFSVPAENQQVARGEYLVGVRYIWVHKDYRRRSIGHQLLDAVRKNQIFNVVIQPINMAFSQLTDSGLNFAKKYCQTEDVACYSPLLSSPTDCREK